MKSHPGVSEVLSGVLDGIFMASQVSTVLWTALAFRAVDLMERAFVLTEAACVVGVIP